VAIDAPASTHGTRECPECLTGDLTWLLSQAHFALASELRAALEPLGVSSRGYHVLATAVSGSYTQKQLAELVGLDKTTMVVAIDELEELGLAERRLSSTDRRARVIAVTKAGKRKVDEAQKLVKQVQADVLATLPASERESLLATLGKLVATRLSEPVECRPPVRRRAAR
jgi:MarR family transcriptional regulator for hemolysin